MNKYEVGQKWKMRNGCVAEVQKVAEDGEAWAIFTDADALPRYSNFLEDGSYLPGGTKNQLDLVELIVNEFQSNEYSPLPWRFSEEPWGYQIIDAKNESVTLETAYYPEAPSRETCQFIITACNAHAGLVEALQDMVSAMESYGYPHSPEIITARASLAAAGVK